MTNHIGPLLILTIFIGCSAGSSSDLTERLDTGFVSVTTADTGKSTMLGEECLADVSQESIELSGDGGYLRLCFRSSGRLDGILVNVEGECRISRGFSSTGLAVPPVDVNGDVFDSGSLISWGEVFDANFDMFSDCFQDMQIYSLITPTNLGFGFWIDPLGNGNDELWSLDETYVTSGGPGVYSDEWSVIPGWYVPGYMDENPVSLVLMSNGDVQVSIDPPL